MGYFGNNVKGSQNSVSTWRIKFISFSSVNRQYAMNESKYTIHGYRFIREIGQGNFSMVFEVRSERYKSLFCAKVTKLENITADSEGSIDDGEVRALCSLDHPHILRIYDCFCEDGLLFVILEKCEDCLATAMEKRDVTSKQVILWFRQIVEALLVCHERGVAHRDIKPANIFLDAYNRVKIGDFGLSAILSDHSLCRDLCGSPNYLAPEVLSGKLYDPFKADVWSLGVTLYEMATGTLPWTEEVTVSGADRPEVAYPLYLDKDIVRVLKKMLVVDPAQRVSLQELAKDPMFFSPLDLGSAARSVKAVTQRSSRSEVSRKLLGIQRKNRKKYGSYNLTQPLVQKYRTGNALSPR